MTGTLMTNLLIFGKVFVIGHGALADLIHVD